MKNTLFATLDVSLIEYWKSIGRTEKSFYCKECGKLLLDLDNLKNVEVILDTRKNKPKKWIFVTRIAPKSTMAIFNGTRQYVENEHNRWLVKGKTLSGKTFYRHTCWKCFFKKVRDSVDIPQKARKSSWYQALLTGNDVIPAAATSPSNVFHFIFDITDDELEAERKRFDTASRASFIRRYGEKEGIKKFQIYSKRQSYTCSKEYMMNEKHMTEAEWNEFNANRASTRHNFIKRYGETLGIKKWNEYCDNESYAGNTLEYFIQKFGKDAGTQRYIKVNLEKQITLKNFIRKYGPVEGTKKYNALRQKYYSTCSQELFVEIDRRLGALAKTSEYEIKNGEVSLVITIDNMPKVVRPDYLLGTKIIEFYGDLWHANPLQYKAEDIVHFPYGVEDKLALQIWKHDQERIAAIEKLGYSVLIVWEQDYKQKTAEVIDKCCNFLKN